MLKGQCSFKEMEAVGVRLNSSFAAFSFDRKNQMAGEAHRA
jgi:hypothetical protein